MSAPKFQKFVWHEPALESIPSLQNVPGDCYHPAIDHLKQGRRVSNRRFDSIYPPEIRRVSVRHWSPVQVARRAAELLVRDSSSRILDVGSGVGKFCVIGALTSPGHFWGVEQRKHLADLAQRIADRFDIPRVKFVHGRMENIDWRLFSGFYLFNPFYEHLMQSIQLDASVDFSEQRFAECIRITRAKLMEVQVGSRVATYHGFGGEFPKEFEMISREPIGTSHLEIWEKVWARVSGPV